jgi:hypothetical protein
MYRIRILLPALLFACACVRAQPFQSVFPSLSGATLKDSLVSHYKPGVVLAYAFARDTLFAKVLAKDDDSLRCIYSGHTLYLDPAQDPTQYVYLNGTSDGMNTEHAYPQAKGAATGNGHSDMHHLFPARIPVNDARGDLPYADIPDNQVQKWFYKNQVMSSAPAQHKEWYARVNGTAFTPRESVKGDIARAVFYFYTMYRPEANAADSNFFFLQRLTLCKWHEQDPADSAELIKTLRIAAYQEGKPNPFILDCTLPYRTWCPESSPGCIANAAYEAGLPAIGARVSPNPTEGPVRLDLVLPFAGALQVRIITSTGQEIIRFGIPEVPAGAFSLPLEVPVRPGAGFGFLEIEVRSNTGYTIRTLPVVFR